jgi:hypothetical protein
MGIGTESAMLNQLKKAQGETNDRLDALLVELRRTNELLATLDGHTEGE